MLWKTFRYASFLSFLVSVLFFRCTSVLAVLKEAHYVICIQGGTVYRPTAIFIFLPCYLYLRIKDLSIIWTDAFFFVPAELMLLFWFWFIICYNFLHALNMNRKIKFLWQDNFWQLLVLDHASPSGNKARFDEFFGSCCSLAELIRWAVNGSLSCIGHPM